MWKDSPVWWLDMLGTTERVWQVNVRTAWQITCYLSAQRWTPVRAQFSTLMPEVEQTSVTGDSSSGRPGQILNHSYVNTTVTEIVGQQASSPSYTNCCQWLFELGSKPNGTSRQWRAGCVFKSRCAFMAGIHLDVFAVLDILNHYGFNLPSWITGLVKGMASVQGKLLICHFRTPSDVVRSHNAWILTTLGYSVLISETHIWTACPATWWVTTRHWKVDDVKKDCLQDYCWETGRK